MQIIKWLTFDNTIKCKSPATFRTKTKYKTKYIKILSIFYIGEPKLPPLKICQVMTIYT